MKSRVIIFNSFDCGSTGVLCGYLSKHTDKHFSRPLFVSSNKSNQGYADYYVSDHCSKLYRFIESKLAKLKNGYGFVGGYITKKILNYVYKTTDHTKERLVFSIHQIESSLFNLAIILAFAKKYNIRVFITLHDCWLFTGKCPYYDINDCHNWQVCCQNCPHHLEFPATSIKNLKKSFLKKIDTILRYKDFITLICPSNWIAGELEKSLLSNCKRVVINNGIEISDENIMSEKNKKIRLISAAYPWTRRKGLDYLQYLSNNLDYKKYDLIVVGVDSNNGFSPETTLFSRLEREKLLLLLDNCDYFLNPSLEDNFPTVNIEALSRGLKIISFKTGGSSEIYDNKTGACVLNKDKNSLLETINNLGPNDSKDLCRKRAKMLFSKDIFTSRYYNLFYEDK